MKLISKILPVLALAIISVSLVSFTPVKKAERLLHATSKNVLDESINVYSSDITGANDVLIRFERTGPEAGQGDVTITYTVRFNQGTIHEGSNTYTKVMSAGETSSTEHVQGPNPTGDAEVTSYSWTY